MSITIETHLQFIVDGMLGSLARKLRILGFDTLYEKSLGDAQLLKKARTESRILVTSDFELFVHAKKSKCKALLISGVDDDDRLFELFSKLGRKNISLPIVSRCSVCNGKLTPTRSVTHLGEQIYECDECKKRFWKGGHWKKLMALFEDLDYRLSKINTT